MTEEFPPVKGIRFAKIGGFYEESFVQQEIYRTITAGISPYLSTKGGIELAPVSGGGDYDGEYMTPRDFGSDAYQTKNIDPFLGRLAEFSNNQSQSPITDSAKTNNSLKSKLDHGNVTLAEELAQMMSGVHPKQPAAHAPSVGEMQLRAMGEDIANRTQGIGMPTSLTNFEPLRGLGQEPADLIDNHPTTRAVINTFKELATGLSGNEDWIKYLNGVQMMDVTEAAGKKWFEQQMKEGGYAGIREKDKDGNLVKLNDKYLEKEALWRANFEVAADKINAELQASLSSVKKVMDGKFKSGAARADAVEAELIRLIKNSGASGVGQGGGQTQMLVANHYLQIFADSFRLAVAQGKADLPAMLEQQTMSDSGIAAFILAQPYADSTGIGFKWFIEFHDIGGPGIASDAVILASLAFKGNGYKVNTAQGYYDETRRIANDWYIQSAGRIGASEFHFAGVVDAITQPELNIEMMPDSVPGGFVGPITQLSAKKFADNFREQIQAQVESQGASAPFTDFFNKMLSMANDATKAWYKSAGQDGGKLFAGERSNVAKDGGIWPDNQMTWDDINKGVGHDLGVSPFLVDSKEYVKIFSAAGAKGQYNVGLNPAKRATILEQTTLEQRQSKGWTENEAGTVVRFKVDYRKVKRMATGS